MSASRQAGALALLVLLFGAAPAFGDVLALVDGRFYEGTIERKDADYVIKLKHGDIVVPGTMVLAFLSEGGEFTFEPKTELEKKKAAKGYLPWGKRWVKPAEHARLRKAELAARKKRFEQIRERRLWRNHATVETKRFIFKHTLPDDVFEEFKNLFETYFKFFTKFWKVRPSPKFGKVTINIYHDQDYFSQVSGAPNGVIGYYAPLERDLHFFYDRENHDFTVDVMFHEGNHMLTHMINEKMWYPWWIGEGMAEYFGASTWDPDTKQMKLGGLQSGRLAVLQERIKSEKFLKLKDLLAADRMGAVEYAWTWSFCHFLLHTPQYAKNFKRYYIAIGRDSRLARVGIFATMVQLTPKERIESFKRYLRVKDIDELQKEWYDYIKRELTFDRADADWGQAGYIMVMYNQKPKARYFFKKAIDAGSKQAYVYYGYADLKMEQKMPGIAEKYARKAIEIDPLHARAYSLVGRALWNKDKEDKEAWRLLELAHELAPDDQQIWFHLELARQLQREKREAEAKKAG